MILPTHRLADAPLPQLNGRFRVTPLDGAAGALARLGGSHARPSGVRARPACGRRARRGRAGGRGSGRARHGRARRRSRWPACASRRASSEAERAVRGRRCGGRVPRPRADGRAGRGGRARGRDDAGEEHVLLPEADERPPLRAVRRVGVAVDTDRWSAICREATAAVGAAVESLPTRAEREPVHAAGAGGDDTTAVDAAAEAAVVSVLERAAADGLGFTLVSEELGERDFGEPDGTLVVVDPIDGSLNAKRGRAALLALDRRRGGPDDGRRRVRLRPRLRHRRGVDGDPRRRRAARRRAARRTRARRTRSRCSRSRRRRPSCSSAGAAAAVGFAYRARVLGSLALSLCHLAAGRVDAVCSLKPARSVDIAAAQLLVRERGFAIDLPEARRSAAIRSTSRAAPASSRPRPPSAAPSSGPGSPSVSRTRSESAPGGAGSPGRPRRRPARPRTRPTPRAGPGRSA